jgi:hypothetical protein
METRNGVGLSLCCIFSRPCLLLLVVYLSSQRIVSPQPHTPLLFPASWWRHNG